MEIGLIITTMCPLTLHYLSNDPWPRTNWQLFSTSLTCLMLLWPILFTKLKQKLSKKTTLVIFGNSSKLAIGT